MAGKTDWNKEIEDVSRIGGDLFHDVKVNARDTERFYTGKPNRDHINIIVGIWVTSIATYLVMMHFWGPEMPEEEKKIAFYFFLFVTVGATFISGWEWFKMKCKMDAARHAGRYIRTKIDDVEDE